MVWHTHVYIYIKHSNNFSRDYPCEAVSTPWDDTPTSTNASNIIMKNVKDSPLSAISSPWYYTPMYINELNKVMINLKGSPLGAVSVSLYDTLMPINSPNIEKLYGIIPLVL